MSARFRRPVGVSSGQASMSIWTSSGVSVSGGYRRLGFDLDMGTSSCPPSCAFPPKRNWDGVKELPQGGEEIKGNRLVIAQIFLGIDASDYIDGSSDIGKLIKHMVFVLFLAFTFESFIDQVQTAVKRA